MADVNNFRARIEARQSVKSLVGRCVEVGFPGGWGDESEVVRAGAEVGISDEVLHVMTLVPNDDIRLISEYDGFAGRAYAGAGPSRTGRQDGAERHRPCSELKRVAGLGVVGATWRIEVKLRPFHKRLDAWDVRSCRRVGTSTQFCGH